MRCVRRHECASSRSSVGSLSTPAKRAWFWSAGALSHFSAAELPQRSVHTWSAISLPRASANARFATSGPETPKPGSRPGFLIRTGGCRFKLRPCERSVEAREDVALFTGGEAKAALDLRERRDADPRSVRDIAQTALHPVQTHRGDRMARHARHRDV